MSPVDRLITIGILSGIALRVGIRLRDMVVWVLFVGVLNFMGWL